VRQLVLPLPEFLIDRSLGVTLAESIRQRGYEVHTLRSLYGEEGARNIDDAVWIRHAGEKGHLALTKDDSIRRNPLYRLAMEDTQAKLFCLPNGQLRTDEIRLRFLANLGRIVQRGRHVGPYMYAVHANHLELLWPRNMTGT
jgi:hypothetical protein